MAPKMPQMRLWGKIAVLFIVVLMLGVALMASSSSVDGYGEFAATPTPLGKVNGLIMFVSERDGNSELYVMDPDGINQRNLTKNPGNDYSGSWSPDGRQIVFSSARDGNPEIY